MSHDSDLGLVARSRNISHTRCTLTHEKQHDRNAHKRLEYSRTTLNAKRIGSSTKRLASLASLSRFATTWLAGRLATNSHFEYESTDGCVGRAIPIAFAAQRRAAATIGGRTAYPIGPPKCCSNTAPHVLDHFSCVQCACNLPRLGCQSEAHSQRAVQTLYVNNLSAIRIDSVICVLFKTRDPSRILSQRTAKNRPKLERGMRSHMVRL